MTSMIIYGGRGVAGVHYYTHRYTGDYAGVRCFGRNCWGVFLRDKDMRPICGQQPGDEYRVRSRAEGARLAQTLLTEA